MHSRRFSSGTELRAYPMAAKTGSLTDDAEERVELCSLFIKELPNFVAKEVRAVDCLAIDCISKSSSFFLRLAKLSGSGITFFVDADTFRIIFSTSLDADAEHSSTLRLLGEGVSVCKASFSLLSSIDNALSPVNKKKT